MERPGRAALVRWGLAAVAAATLLGVYTRLPLYSLALQAATFALAAFYLSTAGRPCPGERWLGWAALALAILLAAGTVFSADRGASLVSLGQWLSYGTAGWLAASSFRPGHMRFMAQYLLLLGVLMAGLAVYFYWGEAGNVALPVMNSIFGNKNHFAGYILLLLPLALALSFEAEPRREQLAYGAVAVFLGAAFLLTYSRGAWFASAPALLLVVFAFRDRPGSAATRLAAIGGSALLVAFLITRSNIGQTLDLGYQGALSVAQAAVGGEPQGTLAPRLDYWQGAVRIVGDFPLGGTGLGTFESVFPSYQRDPLFYSRFAHNFFLQMGAEAGMPAMLASLGLFALLSLGWARPFTRAPGPPGVPAALPVGLAAGLMASALHNLVELDWYIPSMGFLFALEAGLFLAVYSTPWRTLVPPPVAGARVEATRRVAIADKDRHGTPWDRGAVVAADVPVRPGGPAEPPVRSDVPVRPWGTFRWVAVSACALLFIGAAWLWAEQLLLARASAAQDPASAGPHLEAAATLNPLDGEPHFRRAELHLGAFEATGAKSELDRGITIAQEAVATSPARDAFRILLARLYLSAGRLDPAVLELEVLARHLQPLQAPDVYRQLGKAYLRQGRASEARGLYLRLLAAFPRGPDTPQPPQPGALSRDEAADLLAEVHLALGNIHTGEQNHEKAREEYLASLALRPDSAPASFNLGLIEYNAGRWSEALARFQTASALDPRHAPAFYYRGLAHLKQGRPEEAAAGFRLALAADPAYILAQRALEDMRTQGP